MKKTLLLAAIAGLLSFNANAEYCNCQQNSKPLFQPQSRYQTQQPQYYNQQSQTSDWRIRPVLGADFVYSFVNFSDYSGIIKEFSEDEFKAFSVSLGAKFNSYFGIEGFYQQSEEGESNKYHKINISGLGEGKLKTSYIAYGVDLIGYLPTDVQNVTLLGSLGLGQYEFEGKYETINEKEDKIGIRLGAGLQNSINDNVSFRLMGRYSHINSDSVDNMIDLTAGLRFYLP